MRALRPIGAAVAAALLIGALPGLPARAATPVLTEIRATTVAGTDQVVFVFQGGTPRSVSVRWSDVPPLYDPSGLPAGVQGNAFLVVVFQGASGHSDTEPWGPAYGRPSRGVALPNVSDITVIGDYEAVLSVAIGVMAATDDLRIATLRDPGRVIIEVGASFPRTTLPVFLVDRGLLASGPPFVTRVWRSVPTDDPVRSLLRRLYAGPTNEERALGLRFYPSGSTGFRDLRVTPGGIARLRMVGECDRGDAGPSLANTVTRTLKALPGIDWVKIYDPAGQTQVPAGPVDSIPLCLVLPG